VSYGCQWPAADSEADALDEAAVSEGSEPAAPVAPDADPDGEPEGDPLAEPDGEPEVEGFEDGVVGISVGPHLEK
jgi:hypothetical protein